MHLLKIKRDLYVHTDVDGLSSSTLGNSDSVDQLTTCSQSNLEIKGD